MKAGAVKSDPAATVRLAVCTGGGADEMSPTSGSKMTMIRATLHRVGNVAGSASYSIIRGLHDSDPKEWSKVADQYNVWTEWASEQRRWSSHKCFVHPTCNIRSVRYKVQSINSIHDVLFQVGHRYNRLEDPADLELGRQLFWLLFEKYSVLSIYLEFGDDYVKQWMRARGMEVPA